METLAFPIHYVGYKMIDQRIKINEEKVAIYLERLPDKEFRCYRCDHPLGVKRGQHRMCLKEMTMMGFKVFVHLFRFKGHCVRCKKARSEAIPFLSEETPHATKAYSHFLGRLCEITTVKQSAWFCQESDSTVFRADLERMERLLRHYHIPPTTRISVDEVYMGKLEEAGDHRNDQFFTIVTDLNTRRVIWVERSRRQEALDKFFQKVGPKFCRRLEVIVTDQHEDYIRSAKQYCPEAVHVLDRFHILKNFEEAVNESRKLLRKMLPMKEDSQLWEKTRGKYRFVFLKRASKRTSNERKHIDEVCKENKIFFELELIKERMLTFFDASSAEEAEKIFKEIRKWIYEAGFPHLKSWWNHMARKWNLLKNYFTYRVTTAVSEGLNHVIKTLKRRCYGFRTIRYFQLKILQQCGFINSRMMTDCGKLTFKARKLFTYDNVESYQDFALI